MMNTTPTVNFLSSPRHASCLVLVSIVLYNSNHHLQLISGKSVAQRLEALLFHD
ncbi:unnamed protein product [Brassica napus]|uniref:(rape) hypothetical protein n=1 Tax=Brassica napus TaxID=3708 RepID=A0A816JPA1_BRANA|nr:unnamed protein product [Brassica napus]